jgi:hypothetical protein
MAGGKDFKDMHAFTAWMKDASKQAGQAATRGTAVAIVAKILNEVIPAEPRPPQDTGMYRAAWKHQSIEDGAVVYNSAPYAAIIEYGARAQNIKSGPAMRRALEEWVVRKGIANEKDAPGVAWAIALSMTKKGIFNGGKGLRILEKAMVDFDALFEREWQSAMKQHMGA